MGNKPNHMPEIGVSFASNGDVVDPHVEVGPVDNDEEGCAPQPSLAPGLRDDESDAKSDFNDACDIDPKGWVTKNRGYDWLKPCRIGEVLNVDIDIHSSKDDGQYQQQNSHDIHKSQHTSQTVNLQEQSYDGIGG